VRSLPGHPQVPRASGKSLPKRSAIIGTGSDIKLRRTFADGAAT
jgi:hypothetical protein